MDWVGGRKVTSIGPLGRMDLDGEPLAAALFKAYLQQVLQDGLFHADPHPGNVLVTPDGRLGLIDLGMVARVRPSMQDKLVKLLLALGDGNGDDVADMAVELGERREQFDEGAFRKAVAELVVEQSGLEIGEINAGTLVAELSRISGEHGLRPAAELTMLGKALLNLDEVARALDPSFDPSAAIRAEASSIMRNRMLRSATPGNVFAAAMDAKEFVEKLPGRVNKVMDALAEGELRLNVQGIDEAEIMKAFKKLANRVTMGLVLAALIVGAAMLVRVPTSSTLFGYPSIAIVCFLAAAVGAAALLFTIVWSDRN
jgi:predicted unusual protein kinase regulating ubiquinone biosynthesis (AarF/ABC1/UbiB family)